MENQSSILLELQQTQIQDILRIRGPHEGLKTVNDVVVFAINQLRQKATSHNEDAEAFAVDQLHQKVLKSRAAELERHLIWRRNLK